MASLQQALQTIKQTINDCIAVAVVDLETAMVIEIIKPSSLPDQVANMLGAMLVEEMSGRAVTAIDQAIYESRGMPTPTSPPVSRKSFDARGILHYCARLTNNPNRAVVFVAAKGAKLGRLAADVEMALPKLEAAIR